MTREEPAAPSRVDLADPGIFERDAARHLFAQLRQEHPIWWNPGTDGRGFWSVLRYRDIVAVSKNPRLFSSARHQGGHRIHDEVDAEITQGLEASMLSMDPPEHNTHRGMVAPAFTPERIRGLEARIRARVTSLLDRIAHQGECEFVSSVAAELPIQVIAELLGVPQEDRLRLFEWSNALIGEDDPDMRKSAGHIRQCSKDMGIYALKLWRERLRRPGDDLVSMLAGTEIDGEVMSIPRYFATFFLLVIAGNESVRNSISGGLLALSQHPAQRRRLIEEPTLIPLAAKEIIRWVSPFLHMRRTATEDTVLSGQPIAKGDKVVLWYISGNFDEEVFEHPERFDVARSGVPHLGFGQGQHYCLGWRLAELQLTVLFQELLRRFPDMEPCGQVRRVRSNFVNGIKELPVRFTPER
ncbi:cytochrome P450 [Stigmatella aurantiaca]|uniref:Linalool 8-monooxygenase n=1 Tax=Stigmatella aurantiaca (strain DW4/3-1) TaxID=378806 RepID=Q08U36_STIAD|nr:cytochrome P450 [Stigmatella aurantiaca]ADO73862.1 linalool 8-monooxygenase [Stigmatella aurantiaca DW4/3-1]EAU64006.1 linalool 8-monooxygenase [Stigmatella aurantiaca DW4/3-1]